jgi:hypothetical protein
MRNLDQNSEALNRSISESLKRVNRSRRLRALTALLLGAILFLYSYLPVFLNALAGKRAIPHQAITGALSLLALVYGTTLFVFGVRVRIFYQNHIRKSLLRTVLYFAALTCLLLLADYLLTRFLTFLGTQ